ncbi:unnamed protein product, partial [Iphiclides podalirius]
MHLSVRRWTLFTKIRLQEHQLVYTSIQVLLSIIVVGQLRTLPAAVQRGQQHRERGRTSGQCRLIRHRLQCGYHHCSYPRVLVTKNQRRLMPFRKKKRKNGVAIHRYLDNIVSLAYVACLMS